MQKFFIGFMLGSILAVSLGGQGTLSAQVLRLLDRVNTWTVAQTFAVDVQFTAVHTTVPGSGLCDAAGELGKFYFDSTNDAVWICSGASGWRGIATYSP